MLTTYLGDRPFWKTMRRLCIPIILQCLLSNSFSIVDTIMVSALGDRTLSAASIASQWTMISNAFLAGMTAGLAVFAAQYFGIGDKAGIRRTFGIAMVLGLTFNLPFVIPARVMPETIVRIYNKDPQVIEMGAQYMRIVCWSFPASMIGGLIATLLRSTERVKNPTYSSVISMLLNVVGNYVLIYGKLGFPEMGVRGAALATVISTWSTPVMMIAVSFVEKNILIAAPKEFLRFGWKDIRLFLTKAFPVVLNYLGYTLAMTSVNAIRSNMGFEYSAATAILGNIANLFNALNSAIQNATHIIIGQEVGSGRITEAKRDSNRMIVLAVLTSLFMGGLILLLRRPLIGLFNVGGKLSELAIETTMVLCIFYGLNLVLRVPPAVTMDGIFRAGGDTPYSAAVDLICGWCFALPVSLLTAKVFHMTFIQVYIIASLAEDGARALLVMPYYFSERWLKPVTKAGKAGLEEYRKTHPLKKIRK